MNPSSTTSIVTMTLVNNDTQNGGNDNLQEVVLRQRREHEETLHQMRIRIA